MPNTDYSNCVVGMMVNNTYYSVELVNSQHKIILVTKSRHHSYTSESNVKNMKIFLAVLQHCEIIGIASHQHPFNWRSLLAIFIDCLGITSNIAYFCCGANTFQEYAESIFVGTVIMCCTTIFALIACKMRIFFDCINEFEEIINGSEFNYLD